MVATGVSPLAAFGLIPGPGGHAVCVAAMQRCDASAIPSEEEARATHCDRAPAEVAAQDPASSQKGLAPDGETPCDGQSCCHCCCVLSPTTAVAFSASRGGLPEPPLEFVGTTIESIVPYLWVDALLRPPRL